MRSKGGGFSKYEQGVRKRRILAMVAKTCKYQIAQDYMISSKRVEDMAKAAGLKTCDHSKTVGEANADFGVCSYSKGFIQE